MHRITDTSKCRQDGCSAAIDCSVRTLSGSGRKLLPSAALGLAAIQAGHAAVHHHHRGRAALAAQLSTVGEMRFGECILLACTRLELGALVIDQLLLMTLPLGLDH